MQIGLSKVDITPSFLVNLKGLEYERISTGIESRLIASVMVVEDLCIVSMDACSADNKLLSALTAKKWQHGFNDIVICTTHNHSAPKINDEYLSLLKTNISNAIDSAVLNKQESKISFGYELATTSKVRRKKYLVNHDRFTNKSAVKVEKVAIYGGYCDFVVYNDLFAALQGDTDSVINTLFIYSTNDELRGIVSNVPCTAQCMEHSTKISSDYWGIVRDKISDRFGDIVLIPLCGAAGETATRDCVFMLNAAERLQKKFNCEFSMIESLRYREGTDRETYSIAVKLDIGNQVYDAILNSYLWANNEKISDITFEYSENTVSIDNNTSNDTDTEDIEQIINNLLSAILEAETENQRELLLKLLIKVKAFSDSNKSEKYITDAYSILQLGDIAFVFQGHELYTGFGHEINYNSPFTQTFVCQCTSKGAGGYLSTLEALDEYDDFSQPYNRIGADGAKKFVGSIVETLRDMKKNDSDRRSITVVTDREVVTNNVSFHTFSECADSDITMNTNGSFNVSGKSVSYKLFDTKQDLTDAVYMSAGNYAIYGCEAEIINADNSEISTYSGLSARVIPSWTTFELAQPGLLNRISIKIGSTKVTDAQTAPIIIKLDSSDELLPSVNMSGETIVLEEVD